jgi:hypothetical protein
MLAIFWCELQRTRPLSRHKSTYQDNIKMNLKLRGCENRGGWNSGKALDLCSEGVRFESRQEHFRQTYLTNSVSVI